MKVGPFKLKQTNKYVYFHLPHVEAAGIIHGFGTKTVAPLLSERADRSDFLTAFTFLDCIDLRQEHKDSIRVIADLGPHPPAGDGLILRRPGMAGVIRTADCVPIILVEPECRLVAVVHAGWRGTALRIAGKAARMMMELGAAPSLIQVMLGPAIGPCCFEVKGDVLERFRQAGFSDAIVAHRGTATFLDLKGAIIEDLKGHGVNAIETLDLCTRCREDLFFSARRNEGGRQISFVAVTV